MVETPKVWTYEASDEFLLELGRFVHGYSIVETMVHQLLVRISGVSDSVARAVFAGARVDQSTSWIRRIHIEQGRELHPALARAFVQLPLINSIRNDILHNGTMFEQAGGAKGTVSDMLRKPTKQITFKSVSADTLRNLQADCETVRACISYAMMDGPGLSEFIYEMHQTASATPWRYKPA